MVRRLSQLLVASLWLGCSQLAGLDGFEKVDGEDASIADDGASDAQSDEGVVVWDARSDAALPDTGPPDTAPPCPAVGVVSAPSSSVFRTPTSLTLTADYVFWGGNCNKPQQCPKAGCPAGPTDVPGIPVDCALGVVASASHLYVSEVFDRNWVCELPGCTAPKTITMPSDARGISWYRTMYADASGAYLQDENKSSQRFLLKIASGGGSSCNLGWLPGEDVYSFAIVGSRIYATHGKGSVLAVGSLSTACPTGATPTVEPMVSAREGLSGLAVHGTTLYWTEATSIVKCENPPTCTGVPFVTGLDSHPRAIASDATALYWLTASGIFSCPHTGCAGGPKRLSCEGCTRDYAGEGRPDLQVDASGVYMLCPANGRIIRVAK